MTKITRYLQMTQASVMKRMIKRLTLPTSDALGKNWDEHMRRRMRTIHEPESTMLSSVLIHGQNIAAKDT